MNEKKSIILQVDESTKELMKEIESTITADLYNSMDEVKRDVKNSDENIESLSKKLEKLDGLKEFLQSDGLGHTINEIKDTLFSFSSSTDKNIEEVKKNLKSSFNDIEKTTLEKSDLLLNSIQTNSQNTNSVLEQSNKDMERISANIEDLRKIINDSFQKVEQLINLKFYDLDNNIKTLFDNQDTIRNQINELKTLQNKENKKTDSIIELVTPFWKKWKNKKTGEKK